MLTPEELEVLPDNIVKHFSDLETYIIKDIIRRIKETGTITETALAQIKTLQSMNVFLADIEEAIQETLHISNMELDRMYDDVLKRNRAFNENLASKMDLLLSENQYFQTEAYTEAIKRQTKEDFYNLTQSMGFAVKVNGKTVFKPIAQYYQDMLDNTQIKIVSGGVDYNTAIKEAVDSLTNSGLRTVDYASGWSNQIDVAVRRATLTGVHQVTGYIAQQTANELGTDLVEVSAHIGARDKGIGPMNHKSWQGKVYSIMGDTEKYPNLARVTGYGTGEGLKGWNCRHSFYPFIDGVSTRAYTDEQLKNIDPPDFEYEGKKYTAYEATQKQRQLESAIRNSKRKLLGYQEADLKDAFVTESIRLNRLRKYYQDFSNKAGLKTQLERTQVAGFGKSISAKAVGTVKTVGKLQELHNNMKEIGLFRLPPVDKFIKMYYNNFPTYKKILDRYDNLAGNKEWKAVEFNPERLEDHFNRHINDFKMDSKEDYERLALKFINGDSNKLSFIDKEGTRRFYHEETNTFASSYPDGTIRTFFKPKQRIKYWKGQVKKYGGK